MNASAAQLWQRLKAANLVHGEAPEIKQTDSPWYVKLLLGVAGWWAAAFGLSFLILLFTMFMDNTAAVLILGSLLIGGAFLRLRQPEQVFLEQLALAISLAGQVLVILVIFNAMSSFGSARFDSGLNWVLAGLFEAFLVLVIPHFVHRVFCTWNAAMFFTVALVLFELPYIFTSVVMLMMVLFWLHEYTYSKHIEKIRAVAYGLTFALVTMESFVLFVSKGASNGWVAALTEPMTQPWMGEALLGCVAFYLIWSLFQQNKQPIEQSLVIYLLFATLLMVAASFEAPGLTVGMVIVLLGFTGSNRVLMGIGIVSLLLYVS
ncbi:MAG: DUF4401 domain-containing protein, partial [Ghiorsea sp.]|nr:DUF4401 domain-containing protein [Ghiorsea sp.]